jgi:DNA-binding SARP family transcriptional activator/TolB-like protein
MENESGKPASSKLKLELLLLGPLALRRNGAEIPLPASRKARALLGYLALAPDAVARSHLCDLFWDAPDDPRSELRWCLSKLRALVDEPTRHRVGTGGDRISLDLTDCDVDARDLTQAVQTGLATLTDAQASRLAGRFRGEFLEGAEIERCPAFAAWLTGQRRRFRGLHAILLEHLAANAPPETALEHLEKLLQIAPFDKRAHQSLLIALAESGRLREGERHLQAATHSFNAEGLDARSLSETWKAARARTQTVAIRASAAPAPQLPAPHDPAPLAGPRRASIAIMPFADHTPGHAPRGGAADALVHDVITRIAKLRSLFVIAQGTVFALDQKHIGPEAAGRILNVDYIVSGALRRNGNRISVSVELAETRTVYIIWTDVLTQKVDDALALLDDIGDRIVATVANEVEAHERNLAILQPPASLDAWQAYHRGLWHMYRFQNGDNALARQFFQMAVRLDPTFARAYAGLSFTHWQGAFQGWADRALEAERAYVTASQSLMADDRDPAAHWAMARVLWLRGHTDGSIRELDRSVTLSPNFALAHYNLAFVHATSGDASAAIGFADHSRDLSPFDPMLFGMLGARAMALVRLGRFDEAAEFGIKAAARPNSFTHIRGIAALSAALAGRLDEGRAQLAAIHRADPSYRLDDYLRAFQFDEAGTRLFTRAAARLGLP